VKPNINKTATNQNFKNVWKNNAIIFILFTGAIYSTIRKLKRMKSRHVYKQMHIRARMNSRCWIVAFWVSFKGIMLIKYLHGQNLIVFIVWLHGRFDHVWPKHESRLTQSKRWKRIASRSDFCIRHTGDYCLLFKFYEWRYVIWHGRSGNTHKSSTLWWKCFCGSRTEHLLKPQTTLHFNKVKLHGAEGGGGTWVFNRLTTCLLLFECFFLCRFSNCSLTFRMYFLS